MKHCYFCNKDIIGDVKHCPKCGKPLETLCKKCHKPMPNGIDFCPNCGAKTEKKEENDRINYNCLMQIVALVIAVGICVVFPIVSIPVAAAAFLIYNNFLKKGD